MYTITFYLDFHPSFQNDFDLSWVVVVVDSHSRGFQVGRASMINNGYVTRPASQSDGAECRRQPRWRAYGFQSHVGKQSSDSVFSRKLTLPCVLLRVLFLT